jgi:hypothetical protein
MSERLKLLDQVNDAEREVDHIRKYLMEPGADFQESVNRLEHAISAERYAKQKLQEFDLAIEKEKEKKQSYLSSFFSWLLRPSDGPFLQLYYPYMIMMPIKNRH